MSDGLLHDAWPHDTLTQTPLESRHLGEERLGGSVGLRIVDV